MPCNQKHLAHLHHKRVLDLHMNKQQASHRQNREKQGFLRHLAWSAGFERENRGSSSNQSGIDQTLQLQTCYLHNVIAQNQQNQKQFTATGIPHPCLAFGILCTTCFMETAVITEQHRPPTKNGNEVGKSTFVDHPLGRGSFHVARLLKLLWLSQMRGSP